MRPLHFACALVAVSSVNAPGPDVALAAAASDVPTDARFTDPRALLQATGFFNSVSTFDASAATPTLQDLLQYDAVLTWSNVDFSKSVSLAGTLADYVDAGGGVVVATFANSEAGAARRMQGRWLPDYEVIRGGSGQPRAGERSSSGRSSTLDIR
jgi:hypothetical protein